MSPLLVQFLAEAAELLQSVDEGLLRLERDPADAALVNDVFRAAHTFKGSSGLFDLPELTRLTHAAEDLLDAVRGGKLALTSEMVDDLLEAFDLVRRWLDVVADTEALPASAGTDGAALAVRLRAPIGGEKAGAAIPEPRDGSGPVAAGCGPAPEWLGVLGAEKVESLGEWLRRAETSARVLRYTPDSDCFFRGDDPLHTVRQVPALEHLHIAPSTPWPAMADLDEYASVLEFTAVTRASTAELTHLFRYVPDQIEIAAIDADSVAAYLDPSSAEPSTGTGEAAEPDAEVSPAVATALAVLAAQVAALKAPCHAEAVAVRLRSAAGIARATLAVLGDAAPFDAEALDEVLDGALAAGDAAPLADLLDLGSAQAGEAADVDDAPVAERPEARSEEKAEHGDGHARSRTLKVDQATVDHLLELVGELAVAKNGLPFIATAAEEEGARGLARQIKEQYGVVSRITEELQQAVMAVRMLPISVAFARFPRLVRDLSRKLGKQIELVQEGEDTAADKDIIEMLGDPMVHLVRNSLDHGLEGPDERIAAGKSPTGTITLRAEQQADAVVLDIIDDGRGIDPERIKQKAYAKGLITESQLETMSDEEAVNLVFLPGFSTAEQISDLSGRGVGMDAVRSSVEAVGGSVTMSSELGVGSRTRLRLPLTMAVSRVMVITVAGQRFGVPVDLVVETVRVPAEQVGRVHKQDVLVLRDEVVPIVDLAEALALSDAGRDPEAPVSVLVTRPGGSDVGLVVDRFHEGVDVILKPMDGVLAGAREFCGTALMGDGQVLLVLDLKEVLSHAAVAV